MGGSLLKEEVARSAITPPTSETLVDYTGREGVAEGTDVELTATVLVLQSNGTRVAIAAVDLAFLHGETLLGIREAIGDAIGGPPPHVLLNGSHTHCGPTMRGYLYDDDPA